MRKLQTASPNIPGSWYAIWNFVPTRMGAYRTQFAFAVHDTTNISASVSGFTIGAWAGLLEDGTAVGYVATEFNLWQYNGVSTWTERTKAGDYNANTTHWSFAQLGNYTIATNRFDAVQVRDSTGSSDFADCGGSPPKAKIAITQSEQVLLFNLNDGAEKPNAFAACAPTDHTDWSSASATTATKIRHRGGSINAACAFRDFVLAFKAGSTYKLTYTGATYKWRVEKLFDVGATGPNDVCVCGDVVIFYDGSTSRVWKYDGQNLTDVSEGMDFVGPQSLAFSARNGSVFYPRSGNVYFCARESASNNYCYNVISDRWGHVDVQDAAGSLTYGASSGRNAPFRGDPAAILALLGSMGNGEVVGGGDVLWMAHITSASKPVSKSSVPIGAGTASSAIFARIGSNREGIGGDQMTHFDRLIQDIGYSSSDLGNTELTVVPTKYDSPDQAAASGTTLATLTSSTVQKRFNMNIEAPLVHFVMTVGGTDGHIELNDWTFKMKPAGTFGGL